MLRRILLVAPLLDPPLICSFPRPLPFLPLLSWISANIQSKNLKEPVYLIIFEHRIRLYIQRAYMSGVSIFSVWLIFFSVRISIHQIYNLTIVGCTLEVLVWWDYIYYVIIYSYSLNSITIYHQKVDLPLPLCTRETSCGQQEFEYISFKKWNA